MEPTDYIPAVYETREFKLTVGGFAAGLAIGAAASYIYVKKRVETQLKADYEDAVSEMAAHYRDGEIIGLEKKSLQETAEELGYLTVHEYTDKEREVIEGIAQADKELEEAEEILADIQELPYEDLPDSVLKADEVNILDEEDEEGWNFTQEILNRTDDRPFVIHVNEMAETPVDHSEISLTYFAGDDVLCDERDAVVDNRDDLIGIENLQKFGHGSGEPNIVYVRNNALKIDAVIHYSPGRYAHEIHGFENEDTKQQEPLRRRRKRFDDDE